jgi:hemerythrin superfamily protein
MWWPVDNQGAFMEIYETLKSDHLEVKEMINELIALDVKDDYRMILVEEICKALIPHSRAEESVLYNTLRAVDADKSIVMHSYKEHLEAEALLRTLQLMDKANLDWKAVAIKLRDTLNHHIQEEESNIFAEAKKVFTPQEAVQMNEAFEKLKSQVANEGFLQTSFDMVVNLMPPRLIDSIRNFGHNS